MALPIGVQAWYAYICLYACEHGLFACMDACMRERLDCWRVLLHAHPRTHAHRRWHTRIP